MSSLRRITAGIALLASVMLTPVRGASLRSQPAPSFEEIIQNLKATNSGLKSFEVEQIIDVRVWFLRFRVVATMYAARPARYRVIVREGPWLLRRLGTVFEHVGAPEDLLVLYAPQAIEYTDRGGRPLLRVAVRKEDPAANPPAGEMLVDPARWLVEEMQLHYSWGDVLAEYVYGRVEEYVLPVRIPIRIPRYGIEAVAAFQNYRLNVPIPEWVFSVTSR